jgi:1-deoxy-D-xylulose-5-phosphate reductoisomerase
LHLCFSFIIGTTAVPCSSQFRSVAVLGATGSIGKAAIDVIGKLGSAWRVFGLSAHSRVPELLELARQTQAGVVAATGVAGIDSAAGVVLPSGCDFRCGPDALVELAAHPSVDIVVAGIVGAAGVHSTLAAAQAGKRVALANKESLVMAGALVTAAIAASGGELLPVDSEHSAIFQALHAGRSVDVQRIILTASGGPFRTWTQERLHSARVEDALAHPTWRMGRKITIDSATMMNKALEIIEARWLFNMPANRIQVVVHPQSIVHSMVEFTDGSVVAQLSPPDMRLPIQYALTYPERQPCPCPKMDWTLNSELTFEPVDLERFPAVELGWEVAERGGTTGAVVNAANEAAVELFLNGTIRFTDIVPSCRRVLDEHHYEPNPTLETLLRLDDWSRQEIQRWAALC